MVELPAITLFGALLGTFVIGGGYIGLRFRYYMKHRDEDFYDQLKPTDKLIQSLVLGTVIFILTMHNIQIDFEKITDQKELTNYLLKTPSFMLMEIIILFFVVIGWEIFDVVSKKILG